MGGKLGHVPPFLGELGSHLTMWPAPRPTSDAKFHLDPSNRLATIHQRHRQNRQRQTGQTQQSVAWAEAYLRTKWHLNLSSRLATTDMGQYHFWVGGLVVPPFFWGGSWVSI